MRRHVAIHKWHSCWMMRDTKLGTLIWPTLAAWPLGASAKWPIVWEVLSTPLGAGDLAQTNAMGILFHWHLNTFIWHICWDIFWHIFRHSTAKERLWRQRSCTSCTRCTSCSPWCWSWSSRSAGVSGRSSHSDFAEDPTAGQGIGATGPATVFFGQKSLATENDEKD